MSILRKIYSKLFQMVVPLEKQAVKAGVKMGKHNFVSSRFWSSEPYLITVGSHCQITVGVYLQTHGGQMCFTQNFLISMSLESNDR